MNVAWDGATVALWLAVLGLGAFHGLNPAMGWPLAVANGLAARRGRAVFATLWPLGAGHLAAMALALLPFALLSWVLAWQRELRLAAGALLVCFGLALLVLRRHPRFLARVPPSRLAWWSFLVASAHGAGLMLLPISLGLCGGLALPADGLAAAGAPLAVALGVALVHTATMVLTGLAVAWLVYRHLGLRFLTRGWFNLDAVWGASLVLTGAISLALAW